MEYAYAKDIVAILSQIYIYMWGIVALIAIENLLFAKEMKVLHLPLTHP